MSRNIRGRKTRNEILDAAWDLLCERGADVSVSEIAKAVNVSRQTIYLHFGSRGGMLVELVRRADERFEIKEAFDNALAIETPRARLRASLEAWFDFVPKILPVAQDLIRLKETDPEAAAAWEDRMLDLKTWFFELMESLRIDGALDDEWTARAASEFLWAQSSVQVWGLLKKDCNWSDRQIQETTQRSLEEILLKKG